MDRIKIEGMSFLAKHGCLPYEKEIAQPFLTDVTLYFDTSAAGKSDDLTQTVNYAEVYETVRAVVESSDYALIEAVAEAVASAVLSSFPRVEKTRVAVHKPHAPMPGACGDVSVVIMRTRAAV